MMGRSSALFPIILVFVGALSACTTTDPGTAPDAAEDAESDVHPISSFDLKPRAGAPVFLGVSNRLMDRDDEVDAAVLHVAEQASRYTRMAAAYRYVTQRSSGELGYLEDVDAVWDTAFADRLVADERVEILDTRRFHEGSVVLATVAGLPPAPDLSAVDVGYGSTTEPAWVSSPPQIPGYLVAVGATLRARTIRDTVDLADQEALKEILVQAGSTLRMIEDRRSVEDQGTAGMVTAAEDARAVLIGFDIVSRWASPDGRYHYSLAVAREE